MKLNNRMLLESEGVLQKLKNAELPIKVAFIVLRNTKEFDRELKNYYDAREKLVEKYAILDEYGNAVPDQYNKLQFKEGCLVEWNNDIQELLDVDLGDVLKVQKISLHDLSKAEISLTPFELSSIEFMIEG